MQSQLYVYATRVAQARTLACHARHGTICSTSIHACVSTQVTVPIILTTLRSVLSQGVEIQLKTLQTLSSLLTNCKEIHGDLLAEVSIFRSIQGGSCTADHHDAMEKPQTLLISFKLQESKIGVVSSTAAATLRQLVMFVFDAVDDEDKAVSAARDDPSMPGATVQVELRLVVTSSPCSKRSHHSPSLASCRTNSDRLLSGLAFERRVRPHRQLVHQIRVSLALSKGRLHAVRRHLPPDQRRACQVSAASEPAPDLRTRAHRERLGRLFSRLSPGKRTHSLPLWRWRASYCAMDAGI